VELSDRLADDDPAPALVFLAGLLWPLAVAVGVLYLLVRAGVALGRSFAALARVVWPVRVPRVREIPRAIARPGRGSS